MSFVTLSDYEIERGGDIRGTTYGRKSSRQSHNILIIHSNGG